MLSHDATPSNANVPREAAMANSYHYRRLECTSTRDPAEARASRPPSWNARLAGRKPWRKPPDADTTARRWAMSLSAESDARSWAAFGDARAALRPLSGARGGLVNATRSSCRVRLFRNPGSVFRNTRRGLTGGGRSARSSAWHGLSSLPGRPMPAESPPNSRYDPLLGGVGLALLAALRSGSRRPSFSG